MSAENSLNIVFAASEGYKRTYAVTINHEPCALFGCWPLEARGAATIWAVGTDTLTRYPKTFTRLSQYAIAAFHERYVLLTNCVDERNTLHINWLRHMGCIFVRRIEKHGAAQIPFLEFIHYRQKK